MENVRLHDERNSPTRRSTTGRLSVDTPPEPPHPLGAEDVFTSFCGGSQNDLDGRGFAKLCKDCGLVDKAFTPTDADILFTKVVPTGKRRIDYQLFESALVLVAEKKGVEVDEVARTVRTSSGPVMNATQMDNVRLHDDKSTYTGRHAR